MDERILNFLFVTDGKMDDSLAIKILLRYLGKNYTHSQLHFLITDIVNRQGAANYIHTLCKTIIKNDKTITGTINIAFHEGNEDPDAPEDKKVKSHEKIFDEYSTPNHFVQFVPINIKSKYICFAFAPFQNHKYLVQSASYSFLGLGYNTKGLDLDFYCTTKSILYVINNMSETIYPDKREGGRFSTGDIELWNAVYKNTDNILEKARQFALEDSKIFGIKQLFNAGVIQNKDPNQDLFNTEIIQKAKEAFQNNKKQYYLPRVIEQLENGSWDVECSDGQHISCWLNPILTKPCILAKTDRPYLEILEPSAQNEKKGIWCFAPVGMSLESMRENFLQYI